MAASEREAAILARVAANHFFLAQFEPLRATLLSLRRRADPDLAAGFLRAVASRACSGPRPRPAWIAALDLAALPFTPDPEALRLKAELLVLLQPVADDPASVKRLLVADDLEGAAKHLRFLCIGRGAEEDEFNKNMRYALQSDVLALGEKEKSAGDFHKAVSYLREMQNFMEAIKNSPRKSWKEALVLLRAATSKLLNVLSSRAVVRELQEQEL